MRIDAHQHFWRYRREDFPWMDARMDVLQRDWLPQDLRPLLDMHRIDACIAVQARADEQETDFLLGLAAAHPWIAAVVGWVDLRADDLTHRLERWQHDGRLAGFRQLLQDEADVPGTLADAAFERGISLLQAQGKVYEVLVRAPQLAAVPAFCARHDRHWLVLDHLGKPAIGGAHDADWQRHMHRLAAMPHVVCKLSGLVTEVIDPAISEAQLHAYLDQALAWFGADRLMFGSDWPVCLLKEPYAQVYAIVQRWAAQLSASEQQALWGGTAARCYGLQPDVSGSERWI
jgi:L-fuconolactonase